MTRRPFQFAIALLWLALPLVAWQYWRVWNQLPARMATHFNFSGVPNGWMSREGSAEFIFCLMAFLLVVFSVILWVMSRERAEGVAWSFLGFTAVILGFVAAGNQQVIEYNLRGAPIRVELLAMAITLASVIFTVIFLRSRRGTALPAGVVLAEEIHRGGAWSLVFIPALVTPLIMFRLAPSTATRVSMLLVVALAVLTMAMVWTGFRYRFLQHGLEISALGLRLRSIPRSQIVSYQAERWGPWRGYGIRGIGNTRAFVWGNKVVHIKTTNGDVYVGHRDPQTIVRDLDLVVKNFPGS
ncbi:MAG: DUF1648 domain-containing protein [Acidobacteria bacterium]|nr:DUF1648 domain-containing protein [Acidobacteriota bacterium]